MNDFVLIEKIYFYCSKKLNETKTALCYINIDGYVN